MLDVSRHLTETLFILMLSNLVKDITRIDVDDIRSDWQWLLDNQKQVILVSAIGDMFLLGNDDSVYWLETGTGDLTCVAENFDEFQRFLVQEEIADNWFLPELINQLVAKGIILKENQVYSFKTPPILGGDYSLDNFEATDISVHFSITGQIIKQIWDARDGTKINDVSVK